MRLELRNVDKVFGTKTAVDHVNMVMTRGVCGLLGANLSLIHIQMCIRDSSCTLYADIKELIKAVYTDYKYLLAKPPYRS